MNPNIVIHDPEEFEKKKSEIIKEGPKNLHIIADFDRTLTKASVDGENTHSIIAQIREKKHLSTEYVKRSFKLRDIYRPIELSNMPIAEKCPKMVEWWQKHLDLLIEYKMNKSIIEKVIEDSSIMLRDNTSELFDMAMKNKIPILILSASVGDMIQEYLKSNKVLHNNVHIISNFFKYEKNGNVSGYKSKIIHTFNKNEAAIKDTRYYEEIKNRKNAILLGDNIGDLAMAEGLDHKIIIKICFLNQETKDNLKEYKEHFDVIILEDGPMDFVNSLIKEIIKSN